VTLFVERLGRHHHRATFRSGNVALDEWFERSAGQADRRQNSARVWVLCDDDLDDGRRPLGCYALVAHVVTVAKCPSVVTHGQPAGIPVGAVLLARLAIDEQRQGRGLGARLLADAIQRIATVDEHAAVGLLIVDAIDEPAAAFYEHFGFERFPADPPRLGARLEDIRRTVT
jgi:GNAT superfamily N-acetyltransferase